jgi:AcrR family transcriptional regulator
VPAQLTSPEELVAAARAVLERDGLEGLTLRAVAREAGVSHSAPLRHFAGVATLLSALASEGFEQLYDSVDEHLAIAGPDATTRTRLAYAGRGYVRFAVTHPGVFSLMFRNELIDRTYAPLGETGARAFQQLVDLVVAAQFDGFAPDEDPVHASVIVWALVHGVATLWIHGALAGCAPDLDLERIATITDTLLFQHDLMRETT